MGSRYSLKNVEEREEYTSFVKKKRLYRLHTYHFRGAPMGAIDIATHIDMRNLIY